MTTLYMVVPCYNEELVLDETSRRLEEKYAALKKAGKIDEKSRVVYVNDGSRDSTWEKIQENMRLIRCLVVSISHVTEVTKMHFGRFDAS